MKTGDFIDARRLGSDRWVSCHVDLASKNGKSLALSADEGLPLGVLDVRAGRQMLILLLEPDGFFHDIFSGTRYELRAPLK
jgi:hypothetical protein